MFKKILVANRGEIALRLIRACRELGVVPVAVYSEADRGAPHVRAAQEALCIGPAPARQSYLDAERLVSAARLCGADALHPGYGFLSESADFAQACLDAGITFIGPRVDAIRTMGRKTASRACVARMGVPVVRGSGELHDPLEAREAARELGFPLMIKAAAGGGGRGMRRVEGPEGFEDLWRSAAAEALQAFGDGALYLERFVEGARHLEIQVLGDRHGNLVYFPERECSIQRRHQKLLEESPSPLADEGLRRALGEAALAAGRSVAYDSAGTVEFLVDDGGAFRFLEMNTRLQVEHPVSEMVTGVDICREMIRSAAGLPLSVSQEDLRLRGHAIELRISAEDPDHGFLPCPGRVRGLRGAGGPGVRDESGLCAGQEVPVHYDALLSKLVVWDLDRERCIQRALGALSEYRVAGLRTTLPFHRRILLDPAFRSGHFDTAFLDRILAQGPAAPAEPSGEEAERAEESERAALLAAAIRTHRRAHDQPMAAPQEPALRPREPSFWSLSGRARALGF